MQKALSSHASIMGIFVTLVLILSAPLILFTTRENTDNRQHAAGLDRTAPPTAPEYSGYIAGYVYLDENRNGQRDFDEKGISGIQLHAEQNAKSDNSLQPSSFITTTLTTDINGYFRYDLNLPEGLGSTKVRSLSALVRLDLPAGFKTINTNPRVFENTNPDKKQIIEFGIYPISEVRGDSIQSITQLNSPLQNPTPTIFKTN